MTIETKAESAATEVQQANQVILRGRVSQDPETRVLPSGDTLVVFRLVVPRAPEHVRTRQTVDVIDCAAWGGRQRRMVLRWRAGDEVEVSGALRKRFFRAGAGPASRVEVELASGKLIRRAGSS